MARPDQDAQAVARWWQVWRDDTCVPAFELTGEDRIGWLAGVYRELYSELREVHARQQQVVAWGISLLTGSGALTLTAAAELNLYRAGLFVAVVVVVAHLFGRMVVALARDRMAIARQLDRMHQVTGCFREGTYARGSTLFSPEWYGWGFAERRDSGLRLARLYQATLWIIGLADALLLLSRAGVGP